MTVPLRMDTRRVLNTLAQPNNPLAQWSVTPITPPANSTFWRCVYVERLSEDDNQGNHNVYVDVIDENGRRIDNPGWVLTAGMDAWCEMEGKASDRVHGLHGEHGHTSYYVVFQKQIASQDVTTNPVEPGTINVPLNVILEIEQRMRQLQSAVDKLR